MDHRLEWQGPNSAYKQIAARARNKQILDINSVSMSSRGKEQKERSGDGDFAAVRS